MNSKYFEKMDRVALRIQPSYVGTVAQVLTKSSPDELYLIKFNHIEHPVYRSHLIRFEDTTDLDYEEIYV